MTVGAETVASAGSTSLSIQDNDYVGMNETPDQGENVMKTLRSVIKSDGGKYLPLAMKLGKAMVFNGISEIKPDA